MELNKAILENLDQEIEKAVLNLKEQELIKKQIETKIKELKDFLFENVMDNHIISTTHDFQVKIYTQERKNKPEVDIDSIVKDYNVDLEKYTTQKEPTKIKMVSFSKGL